MWLDHQQPGQLESQQQRQREQLLRIAGGAK